jgi:biopolymer transport protein ExbB/TolQ
LFAWLLFETVSITPLGAFTIAFGRSLAFAGTAIVLLVAVPAMMALVVYRLVS